MRRSKQDHQDLGGPRNHHSTRQTSTSRKKRLDSIEKAKMIKELVAPVFNFPSTASYSQEIDIAESEDTRSTTEGNESLAPNGNLSHVDHQEWLQYSSATMEFRWGQQSCTQNGDNDLQDTSLSPTWKYQAQMEEPFKDVKKLYSTSVATQRGGSPSSTEKRENSS